MSIMAEAHRITKNIKEMNDSIIYRDVYKNVFKSLRDGKTEEEIVSSEVQGISFNKEETKEETKEEESSKREDGEEKKPLIKKRAIEITFLNGEIKEYESCSQAVRELNLKNKNCISSYWIKGKCLKAMNNSGIKEIKYI